MLLLVLAVFLAACQSGPARVLSGPTPGEEEWSPTLITANHAGREKGSLYASSQRFSLFQDRRAYRTGDILTVTLDEATEVLRQYPDIRVEVAGHTDSIGSDQYNQGLSERRAKSVFDYLVGNGIDSGRLNSRGYGESAPIADNATREGRQRNRRVELVVQ